MNLSYTRPLFTFSICLSATTFFVCQPTIAQSNAPEQKIVFIGRKDVSWLPKVANLPSGKEIERRAQKLSSRSRNVDPFGVPMFPSEDDDASPSQDITRSTPRVTLNQALQSLKLNGVNLDQRGFLIGGRKIFEGDVIELAYRDETFKAMVTEVGATEILFRSLNRNEVGAISHSMVKRLALEPISSAKNLALQSRMSPLEPLNQSPKAKQ